MATAAAQKRKNDRRPLPKPRPVLKHDPASLSAEIHVPSFRLNGDAVSAKLAHLIVDGEVETTIEAASTLTLMVHEQDDELRKLLRKGLFTVPVIKRHRRSPTRPIVPSLRQGTHLRALAMDWELVHIGKSGEEWTFIFEDWRVAALRRLDRPRKANRDKVTRAEFVKSITADELIRPKLKFVSPELHIKQEIARVRDQDAKTEQKKAGKRVAKSGADSGLDALNRRFPAHSLQDAPGHFQMTERQVRAVAEAVGFSPARALQMAQIARGESDFYPGILSADGGHGLWQMTPRTWGTGATFQHMQKLGGIGAMRNPIKCAIQAKYMFDTSGFGPWYGTQFLDTSIEPGSVKSVLGPGSTWSADSFSFEITELKKYEFSRGRPGGPAGEDSWACAHRLAEEVGWRAFLLHDRFYFVTEEDLLLSLPRATIIEGDRGVENIDYEIDAGHSVDQATVTARSGFWRTPPGTVVEIEEAGSADGRWLVSSCRRGIFDLTTTIELRRNRALLAEKKEPAPETRQRTISGKLGGGDVAVDLDGSSIRTPKDVIDKIVIPMARSVGISVTPQSVAEANARHGPTISGGVSDHQGPPNVRWAADMSNGGSPTPQMDALARNLAKAFGLPQLNMGTTGAAGSTQTSSGTSHGFRFQLIYRSSTGGNHDNHVHFGVAVA